MLVSPTEPPALRAQGKTSLVPERYGCDVLFPVRGRWHGIQRKELNDLLASVADGRLAKELGQMKQIENAIVIIEGKLKWTNDGVLVKSRGNYGGQDYTRASLRGMEWTIQQRGIGVLHTDTLTETIEAVEQFIAWSRKARHDSLVRRPGPVSAMWGKPTNADYALHLVMGLPGVGPGLAEKIVEKWGVPFGWKVTMEQLMEVEGIAKKKAEKLWKALEA